MNIDGKLRNIICLYCGKINAVNLKYCCLLYRSCFVAGYRVSLEKKQLAVPTEVDVWFTQKNIDEVFEDIKKEVDIWRQRAEKEETLAPKYLSFGLTKKEEIRFEIVQSIKPRLCRIIDGKEGEALFELTEVKEGGTSIRVTCTPQIKIRIQSFRARFPAQVRLEWKQCSSCGRPVLPDYIRCPYCGQEQAIAEKKPSGRKKNA
jgi:DNA-directed RNA polymerase subunit RPC12/RpoP